MQTTAKAMSHEQAEFPLGFTSTDDNTTSVSADSDDSLSKKKQKKKQKDPSNGVKKKKKKTMEDGSNHSAKKVSAGESKSLKKNRESLTSIKPGAVAVAGRPSSDGEEKLSESRASTSLSPKKKKKKKAIHRTSQGTQRELENGDVDALPLNAKTDSVVSVAASIDGEDLVREISQQRETLDNKMGIPMQQESSVLLSKPSKGKRLSKPATKPGAVSVISDASDAPNSPQPGAVRIASKAPKGKSKKSLSHPTSRTSVVPRKAMAVIESERRLGSREADVGEGEAEELVQEITEQRQRSVSPKPGAHHVVGSEEHLSPAVARKLAVSMNHAASTRSGLTPNARRATSVSSRTSTAVSSPRRNHVPASVRSSTLQQAKGTNDDTEDSVLAREAAVAPGAVRVTSSNLTMGPPLVSSATTSAAVNGNDFDAENQCDLKRQNGAPATAAQQPGGTNYKPRDVTGLSPEKSKELEYGGADSDDQFTPIAKPISAKRVDESSDEFLSAHIVTATPDTGAWWLRNRKIQILIVSLVLGLVVALVVALSVKDDSPPISSTPEELYYQVGDNLDGDPSSQYGLSLSMNDDGTRVAVADRDKVQVFELKVEAGASESMAAGDNSATFSHVRLAPAIQHDNAAFHDLSATTDLPFRSPVIAELSADGNFLAVAWPLYNHNDTDTNTLLNDIGLVQVYRLVRPQGDQSEGSWEQVGNSIVGSEPKGYFGASLSLSADGGIIAIGAPGADGNGYAQVYYLNTGVWESRGSLVSGTELDLSVYSVSLSGDGSSIALGGIPSMEDGPVAKVFKWFAGDWTEQGTGFARTIGDTSYLAKLSADGKTVVVSNYFIADSDANTGEGLDVRAFQWMENLGDWQQLGSNMHEGFTAEKSGYFITLSRDGERIGMGDPGRRFGSGAATGHAHIFEFDGIDWVQIGENIWGR